MDKPLDEIAVPIETKKRAKILSLSINISKFEVNKPIPARFNIYKEKDGKPDQLINVDDIIVELKPEKVNNGTFSVDVSDKEIWVKGKYFVSFQPLNKDFEGDFFVSSGFLGKGYYRSYLSKWIKIPISGRVGIYANAKVEK
ncbi:hypothetical protein JSO62_02540 [Riemerella anatipestifer]